MRISHINCYNIQPKNNQNSNKYNCQPSFGFIANWSEAQKSVMSKNGFLINKLNILGRSNEQLTDLAEVLHKFSNSTLKEEVSLRYTSILGRRVQDESAYKRIVEAVNRVKEMKLNSVKRINVLEPKKALGLENTAEQKIKINNEFIKLTEIEKLGVDTPITGGILFYGKGDKVGMQNWLARNSGLNFKNYTHIEPNATIEKIASEADKADLLFTKSKQRTLLIIDDLDKMLSKYNNLEDIVALGRFKNIMESIQDRKLTVVSSINKPIESLEQASIADHRFGLQLEIKPGISGEESVELGNLKQYVNRLEEKSRRSYSSEFYGEIT